MTHARPLTPIEVDTLRVAVALLYYTASTSPELLDARATTEVTTILSDEGLQRLLGELEGAAVSVRRAEP